MSLNTAASSLKKLEEVYQKRTDRQLSLVSVCHVTLPSQVTVVLRECPEEVREEEESKRRGGRSTHDGQRITMTTSLPPRSGKQVVRV